MLVITSKTTRQVIERWQFNIKPASTITTNTTIINPVKPDDTKKEIAALLRQVNATVTFLPIMNEEATFNVLAYTDKNTIVPGEWQDSEARYVLGEVERVELRGFSTGVHGVGSAVEYKIGKENE